jgi:hypothetical protein
MPTCEDEKAEEEEEGKGSIVISLGDFVVLCSETPFLGPDLNFFNFFFF